MTYPETPRPRAAVKRDYHAIPKAINFLSKPPYGLRDRPRFDRGNGRRLPATWQGGNDANPNPAVTAEAGQTKSYGELVAAAQPTEEEFEKQFGKSRWNAKEGRREFEKEYPNRWTRARRSHADLRQHGKVPMCPDITYAQAAYREKEGFLHRAIDKAAPARRRQIERQRSAKLWQHNRRQPKRLLYLLKQPRTQVEACFLMEALAWLLSRPTHTGDLPGNISAAPTSLSLDCLSTWRPATEDYIRQSKARDKRGALRRRIVFLSAQDELELARAAKNGDPAARERLLAAHWPQAHKAASKHVTPDLPIDDLTQEGFCGVIRAFDEFDPEKGVRFSTFAMLPIEWAIADYKKQQRKRVSTISLTALTTPVIDLIENTADPGNIYDRAEKPSRTSRSIRNRSMRVMTAHISPFMNGLAPETRDFVAELQAENTRLSTGVEYVGLANRIKARGDIQRAASLNTLGGWFLRRAIRAGFTGGEEAVFKIGNSQWRKELRKRAKRKL